MVLLGKIPCPTSWRGEKKGLFCVASPNFESNGELEIVEVTLDLELCRKLLQAANHFWKNFIYPKLSVL